MDTQAKAGWEYKVFKLGPSTSPTCEEVLNDLGAQGWDMIAFQPAGERAYSGEGTYFLKRPRGGRS
jgi:hypothetical protein